MKKHFKLMFVSMLVLAMTLLAGCSAASVGYMGLTQDVNNLDEYAMSGDVSLSITASGFDETSTSTMKMKYTGEYESNGKYHINADVTMDGTSIPMEIYMDNEKALVNKDAVLKMVAQDDIEPETFAKLEAELADIKWLDANDIDVIGTDVLETDAITELQGNVFTIIEYFSQNSFADYDPGIFSGSSSKGYTVKINDSNLGNVTQSFITYVRDNYESVATDVNYYCQLMADELKAMELDTATVMEALAMFENIDDVTIEDTADQVAASLKGTNITSTIKKSGNAYTQTASGKLVINEILGEDTKISLGITSNAKIDSGADVDVTMPTEGVSSLAEIAKEQTPYAIDATFFMDDELLYLSKSYDIYLFDSYEEIEVKAILKDNYNYFPMRQISEMFGETVVWEKSTGEIYVLRDGQKIDMSGFVKDYRTYVKLRDFEKLGYQIDYEKDPDFGGIAYISYYLE